MTWASNPDALPDEFNFDRVQELRSEGGPWVQLAVFCEDAFSAEDGCLSIIKVLDQIDLGDIGERLKFIWFAIGVLYEKEPPHPKLMVYREGVEQGIVARLGYQPPQPPQPGTVFRVEAGELRLADPEVQARVPVPPAPPKASYVLLVVDLETLEPGLHWYVVATEERVLSRTGLLVRGERRSTPPTWEPDS